MNNENKRILKQSIIVFIITFLLIRVVIDQYYIYKLEVSNEAKQEIIEEYLFKEKE